jgi:UDP-2-acetamido-3-amino-2,3-dideoxy-glucuronate N-acetyltransferase
MASIAHVGYGYWGRNLARNFSELGVLDTIVDPDPDAAAAAAAALGAKAAAFEDVLSDPHIDGISIASPAEMHFGHAMAALKAGKHVYVEKPLALDVAEAESLHETALRSGLTLMVGHLLQYHPVYVKLRAMVEEGEFGRLLYVYSNRMSLGKFRREENVLWSFAPHDISMLLGLFGSEPSHVSAQGTVSHTPGIADMVTLQMHFPGGGSGHIQVCWMHPFKEQRLVVIGEKAMAVFEDSEPDWNAKLKLYRHEIDTSGPVPMPQKADPELVAVPRSEPLRNECMHFCACIDQRQKPLTDGIEGLGVLRTLQKAELALRENLEHQQEQKDVR